MEKHKLFEVNQNAIIQNVDGDILILKKGNKWMLPGGRLENSETWLEGLRREVREETGIQNFSVEEIANVTVSESGKTYIVTFACKIEGSQEIKLSDEHQDYAWIKGEDLSQYEFSHDKIKDLVRQHI
ncbi:MAG: hypothetical protein A3F48_02720 [Candidatus Yanofskybacteria bacterium RIFCSPHIGHO2_12_FULL_41_9]|nr:MAG: hypothetical protein A3F48_02720 [Candidatus Yanofskybacteria bacterium RIFCSPHIGHO2_12_FULL_41_9]